MSSERPKPLGSGGFSLLELLIVMAVFAILLTLAVLSFGSVAKAQALASSAGALSDAFKLAQQVALNKKKPVAFYFFKRSEPGSTDFYTGYQAFIVETRVQNGTTPIVEFLPIMRLEKLSSPIVLSPSPTLSTLLTATRIPAGTLADYPNPQEQLKEARVFQFLPQGETDLEPDRKWFVTLVQEQDSSSEQPINFVSLQIDPLSGGVLIYRP